MAPPYNGEVVVPFHIRGRRAHVRKLEPAEEMCDEEVELRVSEVDANARPRAPRKGDEFAFHFPRISGRVEPALGLKCLGVFEGVRV